MSAKKNKHSLWLVCSNCNMKIPKQLQSKHFNEDEGTCQMVSPSINSKDDFILTFLSTLRNLKHAVNFPSFCNTRIISSSIFISEELMKECDFKTFLWATVSFPTKEERVEPSIPIALRVWPIREPQLGTYISTDCHAVNELPKGSFVRIRRLNEWIFPPATLVTLCLSINQQSESEDLDLERFATTFKLQFLNRLILEGNSFSLKYYSRLIPFKILSIGEKSESSDITSSIRESLNKLSISKTEQFFQITSQTKVKIRYAGCSNNDKASLCKVSLQDFGGYSSLKQQLLHTASLLLNGKLKGAKGILLHGVSGSGKSLLIDSICSHLNLKKFEYSEFSKNCKDDFSNGNGDHILAAAKSWSGNAAIVFENLENHLLRNASSSVTSIAQNIIVFAEALQSVKNVLFIVSSCNIDQLDPNLRSSKMIAREFELPPPSRDDRIEIIKIMLQEARHNLSEKDVAMLGDSTNGFVGSDIRSLYSNAQIVAFNENELLLQFKHFAEAQKYTLPSVIKNVAIQVPNVKWDYIGGLEYLKLEMKKAVEWPLKHPESFRRLNIRPPKGILLYGPPGCSKTLIAKAVATESNFNFISMKGSELFSKWVGDSEKALKRIFSKARQASPCVIFFDEIDAFGGQRCGSDMGGGASSVQQRVLSQLLIEMDGIEALNNVTVLAATNRPDLIDQALLRPGRLDKVIYVPLPDLEARRKIFEIHLKGVPCSTELGFSSLNEFAEITEGYSGAEIVMVCKEAGLKALEEDIHACQLKPHHFYSSLREIKPRIPPSLIKFYEEYNSKSH